MSSGGMNLVDGQKVARALDRRCDVAVVGSGPAGAAAARTLARAGLSVVLAEEGPYMRPERYPADAFTSMAELYRDLGTSLLQGRAPMPYLQGRLVGGTSVVNGAISWRLPRDVHAEWCRADPAISDGLPWELVDAAHRQVEADLHIHPTAEAVRGANNALLALGAEALGIEHRPIRRNELGCEGLGRCLQGCPRGHKLAMDRSYLPEACRHGAEILASVRIETIEIEGGRAVGVAGRAEGGGGVRIHADRAVVLAASAVQTPALLLRNGIEHGPVGEGFQCHPGASVSGRFCDPVRVWTGATQGHEVIGLRREGIKFEALGYDIAIAATRLKGTGRALAHEIADMDAVASWGAAIRARSRGRVRPAGRRGVRVRFSLGPADMRRVRRALSVLGRMMLAAGAEHVSPGVHGWSDRITEPAELRRLEAEGPLDPRAYMMAVTHMFGTCRMGRDPAENVVRPDFRHHAIDALYLADSSVFPTNTGVNPQTSILALATLCARRIAGTWPA